jgi:serine O-acetyltransferase
VGLIKDIRAVKTRDPAARHALEIILLYSGMHAVWGYRLSHLLWKIHLKFFARLLSTVVRFLTGVEIHPGARIGKAFVIDHGMGVVIGETAIVGDDVLLYHGVTLGGRVTKKGATRRHPKLGNNVVVGAGALILGAVEVGDDAKIGAGAVVVNNIKKGEVYAGVAAKMVPQGQIEYYL